MESLCCDIAVIPFIIKGLGPQTRGVDEKVVCGVPIILFTRENVSFKIRFRFAPQPN